jgi:hypothetical protein
MEVVAQEALVGMAEDALALYQQAYLANGGSESDLQRHLAAKHREIAREMPSFQVYNYDGEKVDYNSVKGTVTLLAFWFPT